LTKEKILFTINEVKKSLIFGSSVLAYLSVPFIAFADATTQNANICISNTNPIATILCNLTQKGFGSVIQGVVVLIVVLAVIVALLYLLYGGIKWITSKGEKTEVEAARNHITAAIAGLIVVFLAIFILSIILGAFGISISQLALPTIGK